MSNTYRKAIYKAFNEATGTYDEYFFQTYTDDAIESQTRKFITGEQLNFLLALMGEGGGDFEDTAYGDLVNKVADLEAFKEALEEILEEDADGIINKLKEILDFIANAEIEEGTTLEQFIEQFNKWTINGHSSKTEKQFYAFEQKGTVDYVAVSDGTKPVWSNYLTVSQGGTGKQSFNNNAILIGKGTSAIGEITPGQSDSVLAGNGTNAPSFKQEITLRKITATGQSISGSAISTPTLEVTETANIKHLTVPATGTGLTGLFEGAYEVTQMKNAVAKETMPNEGDFDRNYMVDGLIWIDTSSNISTPESKTYTLSLQCPDSTAIINEIINWSKISVISELVPEYIVDPYIENLQLLDIESSDNIHYQLIAYRFSPFWTIRLIKGHGSSTEQLWYVDFDEDVEMAGFDGPLDIIIPNGKVIINNLHLGPRIFKLKTVWSVI